MILKRIYGIQRGGERGNQYQVAKRNYFALPKSQQDLADDLGMDIRTLQNYKKLSEMIPELERIYGIKQGGATSFQGNQHKEVNPNNSDSPTQSDLASTMGISVDTLNNYKKLSEMIPELERIYGIKQGGAGYYGNQYKESRNNFVSPKTQQDLADDLGKTE